MEIYYWTGFSKRKNSTKQPTSGTKVDVTIKVEGSIMSPSFECASIPKNATYFYVSDYGRYYVVDSVDIIHNGLYRFNCTVDTMATYKSAIGGYNAFIARSASAYDNEASDELVNSTTDIVQSDITTGNTLDQDYSYAGTVVVVCIGKTGYKKYVMSIAQIEDIVNKYFDSSLASYFDTNNVIGGITEALQALFCCLGNPGQYVKSVMWFPCDMNSGTTEVPYFGFMSSMGGYSVQIAKERAKMGCSITKPDLYYHDFRDYDPRFTQASIYLPGAGNISLDPKLLRQNISCEYNICTDTGAGSITVFAGGTEVAFIGTQIGVNVPVGGMTGLNATGGILQALNSGLDIPLNPLGGLRGVRGGLVSGITQTLQAPYNCMNPAGNMADWIERPTPQISVTRLASSGIPLSTHGRVLNDFRTISGLSGYVQCSNASISIDGFDAERDIINGYLNSGFYYE